MNAEAMVTALLQWGRVLMNAETADGQPARSRQRQLQWGRVLMNAETTQTRASRHRTRSFNGAAFS